jgi:hypothetical protein
MATIAIEATAAGVADPTTEGHAQALAATIHHRSLYNTIRDKDMRILLARRNPCPNDRSG